MPRVPVWMHGRVAELFGPGLVCDDLSVVMPRVWGEVLNLTGNHWFFPAASQFIVCENITADAGKFLCDLLKQRLCSIAAAAGCGRLTDG